MTKRFYYFFSHDQKPGFITSMELKDEGRIMTIYVKNKVESVEDDVLSQFLSHTVENYKLKVIYQYSPEHKGIHTEAFVRNTTNADAPSNHYHIGFPSPLAPLSVQSFFESMQDCNTDDLKRAFNYTDDITLFTGSPAKIADAYRASHFQDTIYVASDNATCQCLLNALAIGSSHMSVENFLLNQQRSITNGGPTCPLPAVDGITCPVPTVGPSPLTIVEGCAVAAATVAFLVSNGFFSCFSRRKHRAARSEVTPTSTESSPAPNRSPSTA